jgi:hypothetical protein
MAEALPWCRVTIVGSDGTELVWCTLAGPGAPDLAAVDCVANLALLAKRLGGGLVMSDVLSELWALLEMAGLRVEMEGQPELGKEPLRVQKSQKERQLGDPAR